MTYTELHCHSAYSFLDGASLPAELAQRADELGYTALALTDHNSVSGSMELAQAVRDSGVRAIHGAELDLAGGRHLTLLVRDARGWRNLCRLLTHAHAHTRDGPGRERSEPFVELSTVIEHGEGLVCLTGCATRGVHDEPTARRLLEAFGPRNLRVELQRPYARHDRARNRALEALARRLGVKCVATGNVHAHARSRAELQDAFTALRQHTTLDASEPLRRGNHSHVLSAPHAMASRFADHPGAVRESASLAQELISCPDSLASLAAMDPQPPTLVLVGEQDAPFLGSARRMAGVLRKSTLAVIPDAGHSPQFENADAWWQAVSSFLESISSVVRG